MPASSPLLPEAITEFSLQSSDLNYNVLKAGNPKDPLVLCLHGFPELAFSWRKIMPAIADQGYFVVAYDQRGYGKTTGWDRGDFSSVDLNTFTFTRLVQDAAIVVKALGYKEVACVIGHDFGAVAASMCALTRPDLFKSVIIMSHPFRGSPALPSKTTSKPEPVVEPYDINKALANLPEPRKSYKWYYASEPAAEEMDNPKEDLHQFLRGYFFLKSADWKGNEPKPLKAWEAVEISQMPYYYVMPLNAGMRESVRISMSNEDPAEVEKLSNRWLPDEDLGVYVEGYGRNGFQGALNWYRIAADPTKMKDMAPFAGKKIDIPLIFISGKQDWGMYQDPGVVENLGEVCSQFKGTHVIDGAGHWVQQEQPAAVIEIVSEFLKQIKVDRGSYKL